MRVLRSLASRPRLALQPLEGRIVPNGTIVAVLSPAGVLSLTGDDDANGLTVKVTAGVVTLTPDGSTTIDKTGVPAGGIVKSIKADLKGGADSLAINAAADFILTGPVAIALGDGNNKLALDTTGKLNLGGLTVTGGDGADTVVVRGAAGSTVGGTAKFTYKNGGSSTSLEGVGFSAVTVSAGDAVTTPNEVSATNVTVAKAFKADLGNSNPALVGFDTCKIDGGIKVGGYTVTTLLTATTVTKGITVKAGFQADLQLDGATINGNVALTAPNPTLEATGAATKITGNLGLTGTAWTSTTFTTTTPSEVTGNVTIKGGWFSDSFTADANFKVDKNVSLKLGDGDNVVALGDGTAAVPILGNLQIQTGAGNDRINLSHLTLSGTADLKTGGGADLLSIEDGSSFAKTFKADLGTGDDTISIAQNTGAAGPIPGPVQFTGKAKILAGIGNDTLLLGLAVGSGGDGTSKAVFTDTTSVLDGGLGLNDFDAASGQFMGVTPIHW